MKIELTQGKVALVDEADFDFLNLFKWYTRYNSGHWYAVRGRNPSIIMHRQILNPPLGYECDHINHDGLDNRRSNLRVCNRSQNLQNSISRTGISRFKGVYWDKRHKKWRAQIKFNGKHIHLGYYDSEIDAAQAYDDAALKYFGEFARINIE